ncbi:MAG: molecular chaperone DnaK, partial [Myxococcales bacterium]|nr:molecular chaperone DnaK [Myxococcales bacterium]
TCERSLEAFGSALSPTDRADIENDLILLKSVLAANDVDSMALREALTSLETSSHQIYEAMLADDGGGQ